MFSNFNNNFTIHLGPMPYTMPPPYSHWTSVAPWWVRAGRRSPRGRR